MEIKLKIKRVVVLLTTSTDLIEFHYEGNTTFPEMKYEPIFRIEASKGYGVKYVKDEFGINAEVINTEI